MYGVSRMTARNAVTQLVNEGLVYRVHGVGAFVARAKLERNLNKLNGFFEDMTELGLKPSSKILQFVRREPSQLEQHRFHIQKSQDVYFIQRIRYVDDKPIGLQNLVTPAHLVPGLEQVDLSSSSFYTYLNSIGRPVEKAEQRMEAVLAPTIAKTIGIAESQPFFYFERFPLRRTALRSSCSSLISGATFIPTTSRCTDRRSCL
ncbi:hypothetical protein SD70_05760 [Gordoniibacillus kamchatkensis]|uniref:HTH gntR-type domain-containing protein n=1 Tax=Gordoniibacillus kamchatkensis TaxID=1590651 RepID=A0ABR5AL35_9BACL|nr:GntR family transcriptional regulator [Paenibacillus sp. VKM B-2647]KIL41632.1 hypothetical protein SD70_05760 [Paenibacillus sp. VKM B-2647]